MYKFSTTLLLFLITLSLNAFSADNSQKYVQISNQKQTESDKIIVYEFFWYGCPHCYNLEPTIDKIEANLDKDTILVKVPVALCDSWLNHAKDYVEKVSSKFNLNSKSMVVEIASNDGTYLKNFKNEKVSCRKM